MSTCTVQTGFLLWKKFCGEPAIGNCRDCRAFACQRHSTSFGNGAIACSQCVARVDDDDSTGTVFSSGPLAGAALGAAAGAAAEEKPRPDSWHGDDESKSGGGAESSSGDSGGGDSGSSSTD